MGGSVTAETVARALGGARRSGTGWNCRCPAHDDRNPSFSVTERDGMILVHCHAGCDQEAVIEALRARGLWPERARRDEWLEWRPGVRYPAAWGRVVREYVYRDAEGREVYSVFRLEPKSFRQGYQDPSGKWTWRKHSHQVPYNLPAVLQSELLFCVEGEKDADAMAEWGFTATCNAGGAGKWREEWSPYFAGKCVFIIPDRDEPGLKHARQVAEMVRGHARLIVILPLPKGKDPADYFAQGGSEAWICEQVDSLLRGAN